MRRNRITVTIWLTIILIILLAMIIYVIYAATNNPYFGNNASALGLLFRGEV